MIAKVSCGARMRGLMDYLFGPGRHNEHRDQHLVAGYDGCRDSAPPELWESEPGTMREVRAQARAFGWELEYPRWRWDTTVPGGHVWHCSLSLRPGEGPLTDQQWGEAARMLVESLGFTGSDGKAPCRWAAVRHGTSAAGNDHIHVAVCLVREDGTKASTWKAYWKAGRACTAIEERFGLDHLIGRVTGRSLPEASRADTEISARTGDAEPARHRLERTVRAIAAASSGEADFVARARSHGLLVRPRFAPGGQVVTGYSVAEEKGRQATGRDGQPGPLWFGGSSLAADLSLPKLRRRWQADNSAEAGALGAWAAAASREPVPVAPESARTAGRPHGDEVTAGDAAGLLAAAAVGLEPGRPGLLSQAARHLARAAQAPVAPGGHGPAGAVGEMAETFTRIMLAGTSAGHAILAEDAACLAGARRAGLAYRQAIAPHAPAPPSKPTTEVIRDLARDYTAIGRTAYRQGGTLAAVKAVAQATAIFAVTLVAPEALGEARRAAELTVRHAATVTGPRPQAQPARPAAGARPAAASQPGQPDAREQPRRATGRLASLVARVDRKAPGQAGEAAAPPDAGQPPAAARHDPRPQAVTGAPAASAAPPAILAPDGALRALLTPELWRRYAADPHRDRLAALLKRAQAQGHDTAALLAEAVSSRPLDDSATSPARSVAAVLHHRVTATINASQPNQAATSRAADLDALLRRSAAPPGTQPAADPAQRTPAQRQGQQRRDGRDSR